MNAYEPTCGCCGNEHDVKRMEWIVDKYGEGEWFCFRCMGWAVKQTGELLR